jgi:hypothetical protein
MYSCGVKANKLAILEKVMAHPSVPMHGPEHHIMVPCVIIAAVRNAGYTVPEGAIEKALERASKVPGGWCGLYGDCGAAVGVGIAVSVLTNATPLTASNDRWHYEQLRLPYPGCWTMDHGAANGHSDLQPRLPWTS